MQPSESATIPPTPLTLRDGRPAAHGWSLDPSMLHLNHGSFGAVPLAAQSRQQALRQAMERDPVRWFTLLPQRLAAARHEIARFLDSDPSSTAVVPNASAGASVALNGLVSTAGAQVVVTDHGYGAVVSGVERVVRSLGGRVVVASVPLGAGPQEAHDAVLDACTGRTVLVVVDQITSSTARRLPVEQIAASARARGIAVLVDAAHAPGMDVAHGFPGDVWVGNLHKFACAPRGVAALVARPAVGTSLRPLIDSWGADLPFPDRFDQQGTRDATAPLAAPAAFRFVADQWGWTEARRYMDELADYGESLVSAAFATLTGEDHRVDVGQPVGAMRLVRLPAGLVTDAESATRLRDRLLVEHRAATAITVFRGTGYWRLSTHVYTTPRVLEEFAGRVVPAICALAAPARVRRRTPRLRDTDDCCDGGDPGLGGSDRSSGPRCPDGAVGSRRRPTPAEPDEVPADHRRPDPADASRHGPAVRA